MNPEALLRAALERCVQLEIAPSPLLFAVSVATQTGFIFEQPFHVPNSKIRGYPVSTSKYGTGQINGSNQTPLGLHQLAEKFGSGCEPGTVFKGRKVAGHLRDGFPLASITTRIMWLRGLEEGFNKGGNVDTHSRYVYIHGFGDQESLGKPTSLGCIHLSDADLVPFFDLVPSGTLVWNSDD